MGNSLIGDVVNANVAAREVVEHCLSYFAERLYDGGYDQWAEIEMLCDDIGIEESELKNIFHELGYDSEDELEDENAPAEDEEYYTCPDCNGHSEKVLSGDEYICPDCGVVQGKIVRGRR